MSCDVIDPFLDSVLAADSNGEFGFSSWEGSLANWLWSGNSWSTLWVEDEGERSSKSLSSAANVSVEFRVDETTTLRRDISA